MRHHSTLNWEKQLDKAMRELDVFFEEEYGGQYVLHPARPKRGNTSNPSQDGLFSIAANFSLGLGSEFGKGYVVDIKLVTLQKISEDVRDEIEDAASQKLKELLPKYFPDTELDISRDGTVLKIHGDLSLGEA